MKLDYYPMPLEKKKRIDSKLFKDLNMTCDAKLLGSVHEKTQRQEKDLGEGQEQEVSQS